MWRELSRRGGQQISPPDTAEEGRRAMLSKWPGETEYPRQVRKGGSKRHSIRAKQNKEKNTGCVVPLWFFFSGWFGVLFYISSHGKD